MMARPRYYRDASGRRDAAAYGGADGHDEAAGPSDRRPLDPQELLRQAEEAAGDGGEPAAAVGLLDARGLKRLLALLEKKARENLEARLRHPDAPEKFLESEVELDEAVKALLPAAASPELYPLLADSPSCLACLLGLLGSHENLDIAGDVAELLTELTDAGE